MPSESRDQPHMRPPGDYGLEVDRYLLQAHRAEMRARRWGVFGAIVLALAAATASGTIVHTLDEHLIRSPAALVEHADNSPLASEIKQDVNRQVIEALSPAAHGVVEGLTDHALLELADILLGLLPPRTDAHRQFIDCVNRIGPGVASVLAFAMQTNGGDLKSGDVAKFEAAEAKKCVDAYRAASGTPPAPAR